MMRRTLIENMKYDGSDKVTFIVEVGIVDLSLLANEIINLSNQKLSAKIVLRCTMSEHTQASS